jgi:hypothetical protein
VRAIVPNDGAVGRLRKEVGVTDDRPPRGGGNGSGGTEWTNCDCGDMTGGDTMAVSCTCENTS